MRNPNRPHQRSVPSLKTNPATTDQDDQMWELPVTVLPLLRTPIHFSYLTFVAGHSVPVAKTYFRTALAMCRMFKVAPSLLLHPPDFLGGEDDADMMYFPGMKMNRAAKLEFMRWALGTYAAQFEVKTMLDQLRDLDPSVPEQSSNHPVPDASHPVSV